MSTAFRSLAAVGLALAAAGAAAQSYPTKPVRIIVPFPPVGAADLLTRTLGQKLTEAWGQTIIVDNRPGAGGNLGVEIAAKSAPDGYTAVMSAVTTNAIGMATYTKLGYSLERDIVPAILASDTFVLEYRDHPVRLPLLMDRSAVFVRSDSPERPRVSAWRLEASDFR